MKNNMGEIDRLVRVILGMAIMGAGFYFQSWWGVAGIYVLATSLFTWCPPYAIFGFNTCSTE